MLVEATSYTRGGGGGGAATTTTTTTSTTTTTTSRQLKVKMGAQKGTRGPRGEEAFTLVDPAGAATSCTSNSDCENNQYCGQGICLARGDCTTDLDCINPSNWYPVIECTGPLTCSIDEGTCGRICGPTCPDGMEEVECRRAPCDANATTEECRAESPISCVDDYCGGCNAIYFNVMGNQVCTTPSSNSTTIPPSLPTSCASDSDCQEDEYCSDGTCRTQGDCGELVDCFNPSNVFASVLCVGYMTCSDDGKCGTVCSDSMCPDGVDFVGCKRVACNVNATNDDCGDDIPVSCTDYYCGGCNTFFYDAAGSQICQPPPTLSSCASDSDCQDDEYCSDGICLQQGLCSDVVDCFNPSNVYASVDCVGPLICDQGTCGKVCSDSMCPDGIEPFACIASPCDVVSEDCLAESPVSCVDDYCGGCKAIHFDATGSQVCLTPATMSMCANDSDCQDDEYCSSGTCRTQGDCGDLVDCFNPSNIFASVLCVGYMTCSDDGKCGTVCSESMCPDGVDFVGCRRAPCNVNSTNDDCGDDVPVSCVDYYCGGCNTFFYDAAGSQICLPKSNETTPPSCASDFDCQEGEYCSDGTCLQQGQCTDIVDCFNPSNIYPSIACVGPLTCDAGQCGRTCGPACPDGSDFVACLDNPCSVTSEDCLAESPVSCVADYCGGCNAIRFDAMGSQVCMPSTTKSTCATDSDCLDDEYCSDGTCRKEGECGDVVDCFNPSNSFISIMCVGYLTCDAGKCGVTCSDSFCADGSDPVECRKPPCNVNTTNDDCGDEIPISCVDHYCGGCNTMFFDAAGSHICMPKTNVTTPDCASDSDCTGDEYCSDGACRKQGECGDLVDCFNPSNIYATVACVGPLSCDAGQCGRTCSSTSCADGSDYMNCFTSPCEITSDECSKESPISCMEDYCGGCNAIRFNAMGSQVCVPSVPSPLCTSDSDCRMEEYCSSGTCRSHGACSNVVDCFNPSNVFPVVLCVGYLTCEKEMCGVICSKSFCADGSNPVNCLVSPCEITSKECQAESPVSCVDDYCGGCNAYRFDEAGNTVC
jgi:hypothetical protein